MMIWNNTIEEAYYNDDLEQYDRRSNLILSGIPDSVSDNDLEKALSAILSNIDVKVTTYDVAVCHSIAKSN